MAELNISTETKIEVMRTSYRALIMTFSTYCYQNGIDPFSVDIDTFVAPQSEDPAVAFSSEAITKVVQSIKTMNSQFAELGVELPL